MTPIEMLEELVYKKIQFTLKGTDRRTVFWQLNSPDNYDEFFGETDVPLIPHDAFGLEHTCFVAIYSLYAAAQKAYPERFK